MVPRSSFENALRFSMLCIGPLLMIAASHATCRYFRPVSAKASTNEHRNSPHRTADSIAVELRTALGSGYSVAVHRPFVVAFEGDVDQLDRFTAELLTPAVTAVHCSLGLDPAALEIGSATYTVVAVHSDAALPSLAWRLDGRRITGYSGYYLRDKRRLLVDLSGGSGSLLHELVHATLHHHAPQLPEWFDEGLATRFETALLIETERQLRLSPSPPRLRFLRAAVQDGSLASVTQFGDMRRSDTGTLRTRYAHAAAFCKFIEDRFNALDTARHNSGLNPSLAITSTGSPADLAEAMRGVNMHVDRVATNNVGLHRLVALAVQSQQPFLNTGEADANYPMSAVLEVSADDDCRGTQRLLTALCAAGHWADVGKLDQAFRYWLDEQLSANPAAAAVESHAL